MRTTILLMATITTKLQEERKILFNIYFEIRISLVLSILEGEIRLYRVQCWYYICPVFPFIPKADSLKTYSPDMTEWQSESTRARRVVFEIYRNCYVYVRI